MDMMRLQKIQLAINYKWSRGGLANDRYAHRITHMTFAQTHANETSYLITDQI